ncbi:39S ribosomal protein L13, mitochondrial [Trachymyrmex septentrionalis]|uniref:39S ribosomal protein L13, mitochondrial n=1 Tax=Trachymyrmex septentrionalis TaxID=34720 RepID=A0A195F4E0_9HYME|nr:39S ribosomal protein L13, mitochondrial [Trachymyrmex septentrionalis]
MGSMVLAYKVGEATVHMIVKENYSKYITIQALLGLYNYKKTFSFVLMSTFGKAVYGDMLNLPRGTAHRPESDQKTPIVEKAVYRALPKSLMRRHTMQRLHIFPDEKIPEDMLKNISNQIKQLRIVPVRLNHIPRTEVDNFPQLLRYPKNYILK